VVKLRPRRVSRHGSSPLYARREEFVEADRRGPHNGECNRATSKRVGG
jgi:hypothetical protein